jgi:hypothetical protein
MRDCTPRWTLEQISRVQAHAGAPNQPYARYGVFIILLVEFVENLSRIKTDIVDASEGAILSASCDQ